MNCVISGIGSDIAKGLKVRLEDDGWNVVGISRSSIPLAPDSWDLMILCQGSLWPIGKFFDCEMYEWMKGIEINALTPLFHLRRYWDLRNPNATVVFICGPNMAHTSPTYTAYRAGKSIIESIVETLGVEYPDTHFRILRPGVVKTKIHQQTLEAGHRAANYERVMRIVNGIEPTVSHDEVYKRLKDLL